MSSLRAHRDRAIVLAMLLGGLRSAEVRGLWFADVDMGAGAAGDREGRQGTPCPGRSGVLQRASRLPVDETLVCCDRPIGSACAGSEGILVATDIYDLKIGALATNRTAYRAAARACVSEPAEP